VSSETNQGREPIRYETHITISPRDAVIFWFEKIAEQVATGGLGMLGLGSAASLIAGPLLKKAAEKVHRITDPEALELINAVHSLSAKLEDQTGLLSPFHYDAE